MRCSTVAQSISTTAQMLVHMPLVDMQPLNMLITLIGSLEQKGILVRLGEETLLVKKSILSIALACLHFFLNF